jgi:ribosomal protein S18 acetylase RimI-like enzyme
MSDPAIVQATADDAERLASMLGRAFADDPMIRWKLRPDVTAVQIGATFEPLVAAHAAVGTLREVEGAHAAAAWIPPELAGRFDELARSGREAVLALTDDGGARFDAFWDWVAEHLPTDAWYLDFVGFDPAHQGRGYGTALVRDGLARAHASGTAGFLLTETERNVALYERLGFGVVERTDAPGGGPTIWFMRAGPSSNRSG